jgi:RNase H-like domain found in reverse transcriptase
VVPLTWLTQKNIPWNFDESCKLALLTLKQAFISTLVLTHYKPGCLLVIETDASDYALAAIFSQVEFNGEIHPVTYLSRTFSDTKLNYDTHDKELMAIYEAFKAWRHYLKGTEVPIDVVTDHKNLQYFCTTWILSRRQAWWSTILSEFDMLSDSVPAASEQNPTHLLVGLTSTQKERESLMVQSIHKIVVLFFLLLNCPLLSKPLQCFQ